MPIICLAAFVLSALAAHVVAIPLPWLGLAAAALLPGLVQARWQRLAVCALAVLGGLAWSSWAIERYLAQRVALADVGTVVTATGQVVGLPRPGGSSQRFLFRVNDPAPGQPRLLEVSWYQPPQTLAAGERWALTLRLDAALAARNPGGFNRDRWLAAQRVHGLARVVEPRQAHRLAPPRGLHAWRDRLSMRVQNAISDPSAAAMAAALLVGDRRALTPELWERLIATGTNHLVAISGLHIGLAAAAGWLIFAGLWRWVSPWRETVPARLAGAAPALLIAAGYALLAGLSLPTQRALLMLCVAVIIVCARRHAAPVHALLFAAALVLLVDPLAPLQPGFWMSFGAVAVLLAIAAGWHGERVGAVRLWGRAQLALFVGLAPLTMVGFGHVSLISPLANAFAVPLVGAYVVPLLLASLPLLLINAAAAEFVMGWAGWLLQWLDLALRWLHAAGWHHESLVRPPLLLAGLLCAAVLLWLRGFSRLMLVPMLVLAGVLTGWGGLATRDVSNGEFSLVIFDAGYGHASLLRSADQRLLIDTGPAGFARERDDTLAELAGNSGVDVLVITRDRAGNHAGGRGWPSAARQYGVYAPTHCGTSGPLDDGGVRITVVALGDATRCAVIVAGETGLVVFATGLEHRSEWQTILAALPDEGDRVVDLLVLPGHGDAALLPPPQLVHAAAVVPADARRRYRRPQPETLAHYQTAGIPLWITGCSGALHWNGRMRAERSGAGWWSGSRLGGVYLRADESGFGTSVNCPNPL